MVARALDAPETLALQGIDARVIAMASLKPIGQRVIENAARDTGAIVVGEEHNLHGALGSGLAEVLVATHPVPMGQAAIRDCLSESGECVQLLEKCGLCPAWMCATARRKHGSQSTTRPSVSSTGTQLRRPSCRAWSSRKR